MEVAKRLVLTSFVTLALFSPACSFWGHPAPSSAQPPASPPSEPGTASADTSREILDELLAEDTADAEELEYYDKETVRKALLAAQPRAKGKRAVAIAYLLASLGEKYETNRDIVLTAFNEYIARPEGSETGDDPVDYTVSLCNRGDASLLKPLMTVAGKVRGETSETLSIFYSESLVDDPDGFLKVMGSLPVENQKLVADLMAADLATDSEDSVSDEVFDEVYERLVKIAGGRQTEMRQAARLCLESINAELTSDDDDAQVTKT
jgi:hypothetical protein